MGDKEQFEFECNELEEMLIVNYKEGFSYNMSYEDDVYSVAVKLNEQQSVILKLDEQNSGYMVENLTLKKENEQLRIENMRLKKAEKINMEYAEQIVEENQKLRIAKNDLRIENERLKKENEVLKK